MDAANTRLVAAIAFALGLPLGAFAQTQTQTQTQTQSQTQTQTQTQAQTSQPPDKSLFGVEVVVVTGTAVPERTKFDSSVAISTFSAEDIEQQAPASSADLISAVPGFWVESTSGATQGNVFARGIIQDGGYRYVGLMEDGIPIYPVFELSFYNPDQFIRVDETIALVEAVRGGTAPIFTPGAVGGAINFVTRNPTNEAEAIARLGITDYHQYRADIAVSTPLGGNWGIAMGGFYRVSDGIRDPGYKADKGGQFRVKLATEFETGEAQIFAKYINDRSLFVVPIPLQGNPSDPKAIDGQNPGTYSLSSRDVALAGLPPTAAEVRLRGSNLEDGIHPNLWTLGGRVRLALSDKVSFTNLIRYTDGEVRFDAIFSGAPPVRGTEFAAENGVAAVYTVAATGEVYPATNYVQSNHGHWVVNKEYRAIQDDLRVSFDLGSNNLTLGGYIADYGMKDRWSLGNQILMDARSRPNRLLLPGVTDENGFVSYSTFNLITDYDGLLWSLYASDEWNVTDALRLDFGLRYDAQDIKGDLREGTPRDLDGNPATLYDNNASVIGDAFRRVDESFDDLAFSIGFNFKFTDRHAIFGRYTDAAKLPNFDDVRNGVLTKDSVTNIELGYKTSLDTLAAFLTLFQTEFDNVPFQDILPDGTTSVRRAKTRARGVELEGEWRPVDLFSLGFSITVQDPKYRSIIGLPQADGNTIRRIPKQFYRATPALRFIDDRLRIYATYTRAGERYANDINTVKLPAYTKIDAGILFDVNDSFTLQLIGDNLTNEVGLTEGNPRSDLNATGIGAVFMARPLFERSFALMGTVRF